METDESGAETKPPLRLWLFNPFHYLAGGSALLVGLAVIIATGLVGALSNSHHDGVLDFHTGLPAAWWVFPCEGLIDWFCMSLLLLLTGWLVSRSRFRVIDVAGTQALARWPALLMVLAGLLPGSQRVGGQLAALATGGSMPSGLNPVDVACFAGGMVVILAAIVWMVQLMYRGYAVSCNVHGARGIVSFIVGLVLAEAASKAAVIGLLMAAGHLTPDAIIPRLQSAGEDTGLVGTWRAVQFAKDLEGTPSGISDLWLRELEFRDDGTLVVLLGDTKRIDNLHSWHDNSIEWYGITPSHPEHRVVNVSLKEGKLFLPWMPQGQTLGYYVFEKVGGQSSEPAAKIEAARSSTRPSAGPSKDDASLAGVWRATGFAADTSGTPVPGREPELRELALHPGGAVALTFADGKQAAYVHRWGPGARIEYCANLPQSPRHLTEALKVEDGQLYLPWHPFTASAGYDQSEGYCVFEKTSDPLPQFPGSSTKSPNDILGTWRLAELYENVAGRFTDKGAVDLAELAFASDGSVVVTYRDGHRVSGGHRRDAKSRNAYRLFWDAGDPARPGSVTDAVTLRDGFLFVPWRPAGAQIQGCCVFQKTSGTDPGPSQGSPSRSARAPRQQARFDRERAKAQQQANVPHPPLPGVWRAVKFAKDLSGTDSGIRDMWMTVIEFHEDGTLSAAFSNGEVIHGVHLWRGMQIQWYGNTPTHPDRDNDIISFKGAQLFIPWKPHGKIEGYYVFEKEGYVPPSVPAPAPAAVPQPATPPPPREKPALTDEQKELASKLEELHAGIQTAVKIDNLRKARQLCEDALAKCGEDPVFAEQAALMERMLTWIDLTQDPASRFAITGTLGTGERCTLIISDARDGVEFRVKPGERFDEYRLDSFDAKDKTARISANGESYTIAWL